MAELEDIAIMAPEEGQQQPGNGQPPDKVAQYYDYLKKAGADVAPTLDSFKKTLANDSTARQYYGYLRDHKFDAPPDYGSFARTLGVSQSSAAPAGTVVPEHQISHTPVQDIRHLDDLINRPVSGTALVTGPYQADNAVQPSEEEAAKTKAYQRQYDMALGDLAKDWGIEPALAKQTMLDFPDENDPDKLKGFATLQKDNPVYYNRLKSANDIRMAIAQSGGDGVNDANVFNHLQTSSNYEELQHNIALQQEIMTKHGLGQNFFEKLKASQAPLVNVLDPGLLLNYFNSDYHKVGISESQYAGLETEKLFNPEKYQQDVAIIRHNRGLDQPGGEPVPQGKEGYAYDRGVENVLYQLENQGRQNTAQYINQRSAQLGPPLDALTKDYQARIQATPDPGEQKRLQQEFLNNPLVQEANKLDEGRIRLDESQSQDQRRFPLNYGDQATRLVKDAMSTTNGWAGVAGKQVLLGAGETADNTMRFIKNTYINLLGSEEAKATNAAANIGHQALTQLSGYEGYEYSMQQQPLLISEDLTKRVQGIFNDPNLSTEQKNQQATDLIRNSPDQIKVNPNAGQQNLTGKAMVYSAANTIGQILGIADQSLLMGGLFGNAGKAREMANALVPMYASTQNQLYEQALANGEAKPLLKSHLDAAIISLASLINPDIKVVKGMVGAETGIGKLIAGVDESTWNKVLSENKPLADRMIAGTKATARQLGLANLQYGLIVPTAQYIVHKNVLNEDPNLGDAIKDGLLQTSISMALPALLHGVGGWRTATNVNPMQKLSLVEMGLHPKENIELIDQLVEKGQITPDRADQLKAVIKQAGEIVGNLGPKSDGTPMTEHEIADAAFQLLRKKALEGKLKNAPEPQKPAIEEQIHQVNQSVAELHTSEADKHKIVLNQLLTENLGRIREKIPVMESPIRDAIKRNTPEEVFRQIYEDATETKKVDGKVISLRDQTEETYGKALVEKAIELHNQGVQREAPAESEPSSTEEKPPEGAATQPAAPGAASSSIRPVSDRIKLTDLFRTWFLGDMEGKPENEAAKKHLEGVVRDWDRHPAGETGGETFGAFVRRVIPAFKNVLETAANNTAIVTHSSVLKAMKVWEEMGRPDVDNLSAEQKKEFADKYNAAETHNGDLETFKGANGDIHVIRHGQTEDNAKNNFRSGNTNLTDKGVQDAQVVGQQLKELTGGDVPQLISSDLPRTIHSSNIIHDALQIGSPESVLQRSPEGAGGQGGERGGMESGQQGEGTPSQTGGTGEGQVPPGETGGGQVTAGEDEEKPVGPSHDALTALAMRLGLKEPERGTVLTPAEYAARGRMLILGGADPEKVAKKFQRTKDVNPDVIGVVRAHLEDLVKAADQAGDQFGLQSDQYKAALEAVQKWQDEVVKPVATRAGETFTSLQGVRDIDTGSFTSMQRNWYELHGRELTERQARQIKELSGTVSDLKKQLGDVTDKLDDVNNQRDKTQKNAAPQVREKAKQVAQKIRDTAKLNRPGMFSAATPASLVWDSAVEIVAKTVEVGGLLGDAIAKGIDHIKESEWYKGLSEKDKQKAEDQFTDWHMEQADKKTAARIKSLEKQLADLQEGKVKEKGAPRALTEREKELKDEIADTKSKMGLVKPKSTPQPKPVIPQQTLAERLINKTDNTFSADDARDIWNHLKENYLDEGQSLSDALRGTSTDLGLTAVQILHAIATPKGAKTLTDELFNKQFEYNKASNYAKQFVLTANQSGPKKFFNSLPSRFFTLKTYGHGTVGNITHAATNIFRPSVWSAYWPNVFKSFALAYGSHANYEKAVTILETSPNFHAWREAGLAIDPREAYDDYQIFGKKQSWLGEAGTRGFTGLKFMRYDLAELWYNRASDAQKADPNFRAEVAKLANHATGHSEVKLNVKIGEKSYNPLKVLAFAPGLEVSRWQNMITDPYQAFKTFTNWKNATPAEQAAAKIVAYGAGERLAMYTAAIAANAGLLAAFGSKQQLNLSDPTKSDWFRFKMGGKTLDVSGGVLGPYRLLYGLGFEAYKANLGDKKELKMKPNDKDAEKIWSQIRYKEAPLASNLTDLATGQDAIGNTLPWSSVKPGKGRHQQSYVEYGTSIVAPIPIAAGLNAYWDSMRQQGVPENRTKAIFNGTLVFFTEGFTGAKLEPDFSMEQESKTASRRPADQ